MQVFPYHIPVKNLLVVRESGQLIVLSEQEVSAIALHRCHLANNSCGDCVALQDPYCAWHIRSNTCQPFRPGQNEQLQNVNIGFHPQCPVPIGMYFISEPPFLRTFAAALAVSVLLPVDAPLCFGGFMMTGVDAMNGDDGSVARNHARQEKWSVS